MPAVVSAGETGTISKLSSIRPRKGRVSGQNRRKIVRIRTRGAAPTCAAGRSSAVSFIGLHLYPGPVLTRRRGRGPHRVLMRSAAVVLVLVVVVLVVVLLQVP